MTINVKNFYTTKINNPLTNKPYAYGDKIKDGIFFRGWNRYQTKRLKGWIMRTLSEEKLAEEYKKRRIELRKRLSITSQNRHKKRINPKTNKYFVQGDRDGDQYFWEYGVYSKKTNQLTEKWYDLESCILKLKKRKFHEIKGRAKKKNIPFELTFEEFLFAFIKNKECFISKNPHDFFGEKKCKRFYISRIFKSLGFIKGNLKVLIYKY